MTRDEINKGGAAVSSGLIDKLYWRGGHCYSRLEGRRKPVYRSLCGRHEITRTDGQEIRRPPAQARCGLCDSHEMDRRGWSESGPETVDTRGNPIDDPSRYRPISTAMVMAGVDPRRPK